MATPNPIQPIQPLNLPSAAGVSYGEGDVRHFAQGDDMSVPGISNPTRQLAERDNLLTEKLNEVIQNVNNQEQFVPLPVVRTLLPPSDQTIVLNYRIPDGFESRILNASVASNPSSPDIELDIYYNPGFGGATGTAVVTTSTEFSGGINFYQAGEFIVTLNNKSGVTLEMVASILLTLRPLGSAGTLLVGSVIQGPQGIPGQVGTPGPAGKPGSGGVGSPGMNWTGTWAHPHSYSQRDVVRYDLGYTSLGVGNQVSSFYCLQGHTSSNAIAPAAVITPYWEPVAIGGATGPAGPPGTGMTWQGTWSSSTVYAEGDAVSYTVNGVTASYIALTGVSGAPEPSLNPDWQVFAGPESSAAAAFSIQASTGFVVYFPGYQAGAQDGDYMAGGVPLHRDTLYFEETGLINSSSSPYGVALLRYQTRVVFCGTETIALPQLADGAFTDWLAGSVSCVVTLDGSAAATPSLDTQVKVTAISAGSIMVVVPNTTPVKTSLSVTGMQLIT